MANIVYPGRWTRGTILDQALQKAGNTKIRTLARQQLNRILEDLYVQYEWPWLYTTISLSVGASEIALPADFLKAEADDTGLRLIQGPAGETIDQPILQTDPASFGRRIRIDAVGMPRLWFHDMTRNMAVVGPTPDGTYLAQSVYKYLPPDMLVGTTAAELAAYDADIPIFPYGNLAAGLMEAWALEYDENYAGAQMKRQMVATSLDMVRNAAQPRKSQDDTIPLDEGTFTPYAFRDDDGVA